MHHFRSPSFRWVSVSIPLYTAFVLTSIGCDDTLPRPKDGGAGGIGEEGGKGGNSNASSSGSTSSTSSSGNGSSSGSSSSGNGGSGGGMGGSGGGGGKAICGNGMIEAPEVCDDGNTSTGDYCAADCSATTGSCGDGVVQANEMCDDGNIAAGDYCAGDCQAKTGSCGDGVLQSNETCDDGAIMMGCDTMQNGGNGQCVAPGTCSPGYVNIPGKGCVVELMTDHVHINVSNTCVMSVMPLEYTVPAGQRLKLSYHNHSMDYPVTVWMMYGGGYTDLAPGGTWNETYEHCFGPVPSEGYADISTACSMYRLKIHCL